MIVHIVMSSMHIAPVCVYMCAHNYYDVRSYYSVTLKDIREKKRERKMERKKREKGRVLGLLQIGFIAQQYNTRGLEGC